MCPVDDRSDEDRGDHQASRDEFAERSDRRDLMSTVPTKGRRWFFGAATTVVTAWLGGVLTHATISGTTVLKPFLKDDAASAYPPFLTEVARYYLSYNGEPLKRLISVEAGDEKGANWLGGWADFSLPDIDLGKRGYQLAGFAHYPIADRRVVVGMYTPMEHDASDTLKDKIVLICLAPVAKQETLISQGFSEPPFSSRVKIATNQAIMRGTDQKLAVAVVGSDSNDDLQEILQQAIADI